MTATTIWTLVLSGWLLSALFNPFFERTEGAGYHAVCLATLPLVEEKDLDEQGVFRCENGKVNFKSDAPLEVIQAKSSKLRGVIDTSKQTFAWTVDIKTFEGFNSPLQREHFNENYMETKKYPKASFAGKIIEKVDFQKNGIYTIRAKGKLNIHGVEQERIIKSQLEVNGNKLRVLSSFGVPLTDHNITIPKVVYQKIAEEINVTVDAELVGN